ncbi:MAG: PolC-type DNA polymerase III [Oscillospiraceae bacterium]|nr:PolC-type DNA polymerase III [Oscillospiraceae bacterium]
MGKKTFREMFAKYEPEEEFLKALEYLADYSYSINKEFRYIKINCSFIKIIPRTVLNFAESGITSAYSLASCRIYPSYPEKLFGQAGAGIEELISELSCDSAFANGFFDGASLDDNGAIVKITLRPGLDLLPRRADCESSLSQILLREFSMERKVVIEAPELSLEEYERRMSEYDTYQSANTPALSSEAAPVHPHAIQSGIEGKAVPTVISGENPDEVRAGYMLFDISEANRSLLYGKEQPNDPERKILSLGELSMHEDRATICVCGRVFSAEAKENRAGTKLSCTLRLTDEQNSFEIRARGSRGSVGALADISEGTDALVFGRIKRDKFDDELYIDPSAIYKIVSKGRKDNAPGEKRVELHLHTQLSAMDATIPPDKIVKTAFKWGHSAVAITDHGNVQAFPQAMEALEKLGDDAKDFKIIYGMEGYLADDTARALFGEAHASLENGEFVVFDIETTGLSPVSCAITEIGAVLYRAGEVTDTFSTFADPGMPIPPNITEITGITDDMVAGAPDQKAAVEAFLEFAAGRTLIAHNASFDTGFVRAVCDKNGLKFDNPYIDTLALSKFLNTDLKRHNLEALREYFKLGEFNHHRAYDDATMLGMIFSKMTAKLKQLGITTLDSLGEQMSSNCDPKKLPTYHVIILVKNLAGLKNLYRIVSDSYLKYYRKHPRIPKTVLSEYRDGLIVGSACESGELFRAVVENRSYGDLLKIADYYDYLEVQPLPNNYFLVNGNSEEGRKQLIEYNKTVIGLAAKKNKPVVATGDVHFLNPQDGLYRKILLAGMKFADADRDIPLYFRTTEEMLSEFDYLTPEKAYEIVVTNPNLIASQIEKLRPIPKGTYTPKMEGAEDDLTDMCHARAHAIYGDTLPEIVSARLEKELGSIIKHGFAVLYIIAQKLVKFSEDNGYLVGSRGSVGSSFVASMAGISEVNPLPAHYVCPKCKYSDFDTPAKLGAGSGFDLPDADCPICGAKMRGDGHDIPFETFLGFYGDKSPDIDLNFSGEVQGKVHKYTEQLFGSENVFRAGTLGTLADKTAYGFVMKYLEGKDISVNKAETERLVSGCVGVKRTTGQHPGGIIVIPREMNVLDFTPIQHPADDAESNVITTHFAFSYLHDTILKLDELGHDVPTKYKKLEEYTHTSVLDVPMNEPEVYELFTSTKPLGANLDEINVTIGTLGLPEFGTGFVMPVLIESKPKNFADLLQISGLTHGEGLWLGNAQDLIKNGVCDISKVIGTRDSIMLALIKYGVDYGISFKIMEFVRKNKKGALIKDEMIAAMHEKNVPEWYIESLGKIRYMFPKAHAAAYVMSAIRLAWYKLHMPLEFYAAFFTAAPAGLDGEIIMSGKAGVLKAIKEIEAKDKNNEASQKEQAMIAPLQMVYESYARGIKYLPVSLEKSDAFAYLPENGKIRLPFASLSGVGESAAANIYRTLRGETVFSTEELKQKAGITKSVIEALRKNGVLDKLPDTNQISLF